ncbi:hypothetical protein M8818_007383 [Zalaria obscura]|uniref:Uncharacterized protein n=1 Tax=Zalaria obscura TaxID=2024903 RepID=A0ACC3S464_9PEZI
MGPQKAVVEACVCLRCRPPEPSSCADVIEKSSFSLLPGPLNVTGRLGVLDQLHPQRRRPSRPPPDPSVFGVRMLAEPCARLDPSPERVTSMAEIGLNSRRRPSHVPRSLSRHTFMAEVSTACEYLNLGVNNNVHNLARASNTRYPTSYFRLNLAVSIAPQRLQRRPCAIRRDCPHRLSSVSTVHTDSGWEKSGPWGRIWHMDRIGTSTCGAAKKISPSEPINKSPAPAKFADSVSLGYRVPTILLGAFTRPWLKQDRRISSGTSSIAVSNAAGWLTSPDLLWLSYHLCYRSSTTSKVRSVHFPLRRGTYGKDEPSRSVTRTPPDSDTNTTF